MTKLKEKSQKAIEDLSFEEYRESIKKAKDELNALRNDLYEAEKSALQDQNYKPINIENHTIMTPVGMSVQQFYVSLQNMPVPDEDQQIVRYFVTEEDLDQARSSDKYKKVVKKRENKINEINDIYTDFWNEQVKDVADTVEDKIIYMLVGINKDIRSRKLNDITGIPLNKCRKYKLTDKNIVEKTE